MARRRELERFVQRVGLETVAARVGRAASTVRRWLSAGVPASARETVERRIRASKAARKAARTRKRRQREAAREARAAIRQTAERYDLWEGPDDTELPEPLPEPPPKPTTVVPGYGPEKLSRLAKLRAVADSIQAVATLSKPASELGADYWQTRAEQLEKDLKEAKELAAEAEEANRAFQRETLRVAGESLYDMMVRLANFAADRGMLDIEFERIAYLTGFRPNQVYSTGMGSPPSMGRPA